MSALASLLAAGLATTSAQADQTSAPQLAQLAVRAFETVCLANRAAGADAALAAMRDFPGATALPDLPYGRTALKSFASGPIAFMLRPDRRGFGCFVGLAGDEGGATEVINVLNGVAGLSPRTSRNRRNASHEWDVIGSSDRVILGAGAQPGDVLINLEVEGR